MDISLKDKIDAAFQEREDEEIELDKRGMTDA